MSRVAALTDNAVIESLNRRIKFDINKNLITDDYQDAWAAIEIYVNYFNNENHLAIYIT